MIIKHKQDYNKLAYYFTVITDNDDLSYSECDTILQGLLKILKLDNPNFDETKFLKKINNIKHGGL